MFYVMLGHSFTAIVNKWTLHDIESISDLYSYTESGLLHSFFMLLL